MTPTMVRVYVLLLCVAMLVERAVGDNSVTDVLLIVAVGLLLQGKIKGRW